MSIFPVTKKDLRVDTFCSGGPGGQHQNRTETGVRITHLKTGINTECRETRSQDENKKRAFRKLAKRLVEYQRLQDFKPVQRVNERIRTYHEPRGEVKDHRTGKTYSFEDIVTTGKGLDELLKDCFLAGLGNGGEV